MIEPGTAVRFIGGKYNGFQGTVRWSGDDTCSVVVESAGGRQDELIESNVHLMPLALWQAAQPHG